MKDLLQGWERICRKRWLKMKTFNWVDFGRIQNRYLCSLDPAWGLPSGMSQALLLSVHLTRDGYPSSYGPLRWCHHSSRNLAHTRLSEMSQMIPNIDQSHGNVSRILMNAQERA